MLLLWVKAWEPFVDSGRRTLMRRLLSFLFVLALAAAGCGDTPTTVTAGDDTTDAAGAEESSDVTGTAAASVADDSAPIEVGPTTTAPWEVTLEEYPLLTLLDDQRGGVGAGSASFVLTNQDGTPTASGSKDHPAFLVRLDAWYGVNNYNDIEFTIGTSNILLVDSQPREAQCGGNWAWLSQQSNSQFVRLPGQFPKVHGTEFAADASGCVENRPMQFDSLFDVPVTIDVDTDGFTLLPVDGDGDPHYFVKLDPPPLPDVPATTINVPATTEPPPETTTTTTAAAD